MFVCYLIKSVPYKESARDAPCQLRDSGARFLEGCRSPSCNCSCRSAMNCCHKYYYALARGSKGHVQNVSIGISANSLGGRLGMQYIMDMIAAQET